MRRAFNLNTTGTVDSKRWKLRFVEKRLKRGTRIIMDLRSSENSSNAFMDFFFDLTCG
jgi:hypothetical protein